MSCWIFRDYLNVRGENEVLRWTNSLPQKAQAKIDTIILLLRGFEVWPEQYVSAVRGCPGIFELKVKWGGIQYRPLGFYGPGRREFTLLLGAIEKGGKLPPNACDTASQRKRIVLRDRGRSREHEFI